MNQEQPEGTDQPDRNDRTDQPDRNEQPDRYVRPDPDGFFFKEIYRDNVFLLLMVAGKILNRHDAEDVVAEVFARLWDQRHRLPEIRNTRSFLITMVKNACFDFLRSEKRMLLREQQWTEQSMISTENEVGEGSAIDLRSHYKAFLHSYIQALPKKCRVIFQLAFYEELDNQQIARQLGIKPGTVKAQKVKALRLLRLARITRNMLLSIVPFFLAATSF